MEKTVTYFCSQWDKVGFVCESQCFKCAKVDRTENYIINLCILQFMGEVIADGYSDCPYPVIRSKDGNFAVRYHESWDELIPVVNKIYSLYQDKNHFLKMMLNKAAIVRVSNIGKALSTAEIKPVLKSVYRFIEWYNINQLKQTE